ncbi:MAG: B12-binding domain-containing radical SAM protein [Phycisphaerales bacterium]|nr:MAG: B12-binding domain-containing radical SAM protein [Phycisphaerales bacterium]
MGFPLPEPGNIRNTGTGPASRRETAARTEYRCVRVLLVKPNNFSDHIQPPLGLGYLAAQLRRDHDVDIYDCIKEKASPERLAEVAEAFRADLVGVQCYTFDISKVMQILQAVKTRCPQTLTVVGGADMTTDPVAAMRHFGPDCDYGFAGEGEIHFPVMLQEIESKRTSFDNVPGAVWRHNGRVVANPPFLAPDLDALGVPALDLLRPDTYPEAQQGAFFEKFPICPIITTRGCPFRCRFCAAPLLAGRTVRRHSIGYVRNLIALLYHRYNIREFHILDDNFTVDIGYAKSVMREIIHMGLDISLAMPNGIRMDCVDDELLELMKAAGVYIVSVAVESGSDHILRAMNKGTTTERIRANVARIRRHGLDVAGFFIMGYPGETVETIRTTARFARELDIQRAQFMTFVPLPGSAVHDSLVADGEISPNAWEGAHFAFAPYAPRGMARRKLRSLQRSAFLWFYLRPTVLVRHVLAIRSYRHFRFLLARFYRWILMKPATAEPVGWADPLRRLLGRVKRILSGPRDREAVSFPSTDVAR